MKLTKEEKKGFKRYTATASNPIINFYLKEAEGGGYYLTEEIKQMEREHSYNPQQYLDSNPALARVVEQLVDGTYDPTHQIFKELYDSLVYGVEGQRADVYYVLADFDSYCKAQERIAAEYMDKKLWAKKTLINIANSGKFSSDRTIEDYVRDIWKIKKLEVK